MKNRLIPALLCLSFLLFRFPLPVAAQPATSYFSFHMDPSSADGGELARLEVEACRTEVTAAGFRLQVSFDEDELTFLGTETSGAVKSGTMRTNSGSGQVTCVYVCNTDKGYAPQLSGTVASFLFEVEPGVKAGKTALTVKTDQICDYDGNPLEADEEETELTLKLSPALSSQARLTALVPSAGTLEPDFSPSVAGYSLSVGSDVDSVELQADAAEGGSVRVSRKTLNGAGKETQIVVTVTSADGSETAQYFVRVSRVAKEAVRAAASGETGKAAEPASGPPADRPEAETGKAKSGGETGGPETSAPESEAGSPGAESAAAGQTAVRTEDVPQASGNRTPLILTGDRMPSYLVGMLASALCVTVGIALSLWLPIRPKK